MKDFYYRIAQDEYNKINNVKKNKMTAAEIRHKVSEMRERREKERELRDLREKKAKEQMEKRT